MGGCGINFSRSIDCLLSIAVAYATARLSMCTVRLLISSTSPGSNPSRGAKLGQANAGTYVIGLIYWAVSCHQEASI